MEDQFVESRKAVAKAREAMRIGDHNEARVWAERAAELAPTTEDPWLLMTALSEPHEALEYARKALEISPESPRAKRGLDWALERAGQKAQPRPGQLAQARQESQSAPDAPNPFQPGQAARPAPTAKKRRSPVFPVLLLLLGCAVVALAAWSATSSPALASILSLGGVAGSEPPMPPQYWAQVQIPKPTYAAAAALATNVSAPALSSNIQEPATQEPAREDAPAPQVQESLPTATESQAPEPLIADTVTPDIQATLEAGYTATPLMTETPAQMVAQIIPDTPTSEYVPPTSAPVAANQPSSDSATVANVGNGEHWIDVDLSQQRVYAYAGDTVVNSFVVSTGTWQTPTVTGQFHIWIKLRSTTMTGPGYYLPNVPYTMYFYKGYGLHGTYWHNNFGTPMSHGCVNLSIPDSEWLYNFSSVGTLVNVHY